MFKRALDIMISLIGIVLLFPLFLFLALLIKLDSSGPIFFRQERIGKNGRLFNIFKLRTMITDAEKRWKQEFKPVVFSNFYFQERDDPRVTRIGRFLRRGFDELPQLLNVLKGDMSLVGPRPEVPEIVALYSDREKQLLSVLPGITCLSTVMGRGHLSKEQINEYDLKYVKDRSLLFDFYVMFKTLWEVLITGKGAI